MAFTEFRRGTVCFSFCVSLSQLKLSRDTRWKKKTKGAPSATTWICYFFLSRLQLGCVYVCSIGSPNSLSTPPSFFFTRIFKFCTVSEVTQGSGGVLETGTAQPF